MKTEKQIANEANLRPVRTKEEARARGTNGGIKSGEARREKKLLSDLLLRKLAMKLNGTDITYGQAVVDSWIESAVDGDIKAITSLADRVEGKPVQQVQVQGNVDVAQALLSARKQVTQDE